MRRGLLLILWATYPYNTSRTVFFLVYPCLLLLKIVYLKTFFPSFKKNPVYGSFKIYEAGGVMYLVCSHMLGESCHIYVIQVFVIVIMWWWFFFSAD